MSNYHKLGGLNNRDLFYHSGRGLKSKNNVASRMYALWGSRGDLFFCCFWWHQIFLGLFLHNSNLCLHLHMAFSPVGLYISNVPLFSLIGTLVIEFGALSKHRKISSQDPQLSYVCKESISKKVYSLCN